MSKEVLIDSTVAKNQFHGVTVNVMFPFLSFMKKIIPLYQNNDSKLWMGEFVVWQASCGW